VVIGKKEKVVDLKFKIAELYKSEKISVENIVVMKGWSTVTITAQSAYRLEWFHQTVLKTLPENHGQSEEELLFLQRNAIAQENEMTIGTPSGFHLRSGDVLVWQDITLRPPEQSKEKLKKEAEERNKRKLQRNPNFKPGTGIRGGTGGFEPGTLTILTHEEWQQREQRKKLEEEKSRAQQLEAQAQAQSQTQTQPQAQAQENNVPTTSVENTNPEDINEIPIQSIGIASDEVDLQKMVQEEKKTLQRKKSF